jgi:uncharacterized protein DUF1861
MDSTNANREPAQLSDAKRVPEIMRVSELFDQFKAGRDKVNRSTQQLLFAGVDGHDVYNITAPFRSGDITVIAGRVEPRHHEFSKIVFFEEKQGVWYPVPDAPLFDLQDPFFCFVRGELVFGGVRIHENDSGLLGWKTVFFRGSDIFDLKEFFVGPNGMKDIRLCDLQDGRIGVFSRPQGMKGGRGTIGYTEISRLEDLTLDVLDAAPLIENMFHPSDWGGANETHLLPGGEIGVLAHAAYYENDDCLQDRHYYATAFTFNPQNRTFRNYKVIASRDQFPDGHAKRPDLKDVIFSSGLVRSSGETRLYAGLSDAEAHWIAIPYPF